MTEQSALEQAEQQGPAYIYPDDAIKIVHTEDNDEKMQTVEAILKGTTDGTIVLHPELAMVTFMVLCSDPEVMDRVFEFKGLSWEYVNEMFTTQKQQIINEIMQIKQQIQQKEQLEEPASAYELQMQVAEPYVQQAFVDNRE